MGLRLIKFWLNVLNIVSKFYLWSSKVVELWLIIVLVKENNVNGVLKSILNIKVIVKLLVINEVIILIVSIVKLIN